jgi:hypothetical protein
MKALRRKGIQTIAQANRYLHTSYLDDHNARFASAEQLPDVHRPCEGYDLTNIFCFQTERQVLNDYTITLEGTYVQLKRSEAPLPPPRQYVTVRRWLDGSLHIFWKEHELDFSVLKAKPRSNGPRLLHPHQIIPGATSAWAVTAVQPQKELRSPYGLLPFKELQQMIQKKKGRKRWSRSGLSTTLIDKLRE